MAKIVRLVIPKWAICHNVSASHTEVCPFLACPQVSLVFRGNRAIFAPVMYISSLDACSWFNNSGLYFNTNITETWSFMSAEWVTLSFTLFSYSQSPSHSLSLQLFFLFSSPFFLPHILILPFLLSFFLNLSLYLLYPGKTTFWEVNHQPILQLILWLISQLITLSSTFRLTWTISGSKYHFSPHSARERTTQMTTWRWWVQTAYEDRLCELHGPLQCISLTFVLLQCAYPGQDIQLKITALDQLSQITYGFVQITTQVRECSLVLRPFLAPVFDCLQLQKQSIPFLYSYCKWSKLKVGKAWKWGEKEWLSEGSEPINSMFATNIV